MALVVSIPNECTDALTYTFDALYNKRLKHRKLSNNIGNLDNSSHCWVERNKNQTLVVVDKILLTKYNGDVDHMFESIISPMLKDTLKHS